MLDTVVDALGERPDPTAEGRQFSEALIQLPNPAEPLLILLFFTNLVEPHALQAIRPLHGAKVKGARPRSF